jgi:hypothetical protein
VRVIRVDLDERKIDLDYVGRDGEGTPMSAAPKPGKTKKTAKSKPRR